MVLVPRELTDTEYRVLNLLSALDTRTPKGGGQTTSPRQEFAKVEITVPREGQSPLVVSLGEVMGRMQLFPRLKLTDEQRRQLDRMRFGVRDEGGEVLAVTGLEVFDVLQNLEQAQLPGKLLGAHRAGMPVVPDREMVDPRYTYMLLFIVVIVVLWFGCNNAAKEIVKEEAVYGRERAVNLGILPYLASKFVVLSALTAAQALALMLLVFGGLGLSAWALGMEVPYPAYRLDYPALFGVLVLLAMAGVALGLLLSACVSSPDRANALLPYVLIPQIILGGGLMPVATQPLYGLAVLLSPVYWAYRAAHRGAQELPVISSYHVEYGDGIRLPCLALLAQAAVLLLLTAWSLRRKDLRTA
jgi:ABC-type multidrug transport system permease subunit